MSLDQHYPKVSYGDFDPRGEYSQESKLGLLQAELARRDETLKGLLAHINKVTSPDLALTYMLLWTEPNEENPSPRLALAGTTCDLNGFRPVTAHEVLIEKVDGQDCVLLVSDEEDAYPSMMIDDRAEVEAFNRLIEACNGEYRRDAAPFN